MDTASNAFECLICLDAPTEPKFLSCHHSFCKSCLEDLAKSNHRLDCPSCRKITDIPTGGISMLQSNFYILEQQKQKNQRCESGNCKQKDTFCKNCQQYLCNSCVRVHNSFGGVKDHVLIPTNGDLAISLEHIIPFCDKHPGQILDCYCFTCSDNVCCKCNVETLLHRSHDVVDLQLAEIQCKTELEKIKKNLDNLSNYFSDNLAFGESTLKERNDLCNETCDSIDKQAKELCEEVNTETAKIASIITDNEYQFEAQAIDYLQKIQCYGGSHHDVTSTQQYISSDILTTAIELTDQDTSNQNCADEFRTQIQIQCTPITCFIRKFNVCDLAVGKLKRSERFHVGQYSFTLTAKRWVDKSMKPTAMEKLRVMFERNDDIGQPLEAFIRIKLINPLKIFEQTCMFSKKGSKKGCASFLLWQEIKNVLYDTDVIIFRCSIAI